MIITSAILPSDKFGKLGLGDIEMKRLGPVVLIAGQNGSGKTRLLQVIRSAIGAAPKQADRENAKNHLKRLQSEEQNINTEMEKAQSAITLSEIADIPPGPNTPASRLEALRNRKIQITREITAQKQVAEWNYLQFSDVFNGVFIVNFVPKNLNLIDADALPPNQMEERSKLVDNVGVEHLAGSCFARIQTITKRYIMSTHPDLASESTEAKANIAEYERLKESIRRFMSTDLKFNENGQATLFGRPLGQTALSDGQKVLLQFCMALYAQAKSLSNVILIMDEPENHLHPSLLVEVLDRIVSNLTSGQIFMATHSIHLLAHFDQSAIYYMENGNVSYAGNIPEKVLSGLLGSENEIGKLNDFLSLPAQFASLQFAVESLFPPQAVITGSGDPQTLQIVEALKELKDRKIKILDYGAGKGRLLTSLFEHSVLANVDYFAYDRFDVDKETCKAIISNHYETADRRYFNTQQDMMSAIDTGSIDVIIMCNVLHEIPPNEWISLFDREGAISRLLADAGYLLIVEDYQMPKGERAHSKGFILLDECHLRILFKIPQEYKEYKIRAKRARRLKAHYIPKPVLTNVSDSTRKDALNMVKKTALEGISRLREEPPSFSNGKLYALYVHQFANACLSLQDYSMGN